MTNILSLGTVQFKGKSYTATIHVCDDSGTPVDVASMQSKKHAFEEKVKEILALHESTYDESTQGAIRIINFKGVDFEKGGPILHTAKKTDEQWKALIFLLSNADCITPKASTHVKLEPIDNKFVKLSEREKFEVVERVVAKGIQVLKKESVTFTEEEKDCLTAYGCPDSQDEQKFSEVLLQLRLMVIQKQLEETEFNDYVIAPTQINTSA